MNSYSLGKTRDFFIFSWKDGIIKISNICFGVPMEKINYEKLPLRYILCIDVKSFFASVEAVRRGINPLEAWIAVVSDIRRPGGVVLAASPNVKKYCNIKTGNRKFEILDRRVEIVNPSMALYLEFNRKIHDIFLSYTSKEDINVYSIDESFLDVTNSYQLFGDPYEIAVKIKERIFNELGLAVTIGIGDNPLLAKLALDNEAKKVEEQISYWSYEDIPNTLWKIEKLTDFWGISRGWEKRLNKLGIYTIKQLANFDKRILEKKYGIMGLQQYYHANGVDYSIIKNKVKTKNKGFSKGQILMRDYVNEGEIMGILEEMVDEVALRLRKHKLVAKSMALYCGFSSNEINPGFALTKSFNTPLSDTRTILDYFKRAFYENWTGERVRQFNISLQELEEDLGHQISMFELRDIKNYKLDTTLDSIRDRFGLTSVFKAQSLNESSTFFERAKFVGGHKGMSEIED